jgi:hypothetical protein
MHDDDAPENVTSGSIEAILHLLNPALHWQDIGAILDRGALGMRTCSRPTSPV